MSESISAPLSTHSARLKLEPYTAEIRLGSLRVGIDNIHYDVYLSLRFSQLARRYILDLLRHAVNLNAFFGLERKPTPPPETGAFRKQLTELLQCSLKQAKYAQNIEVDLLLRTAVLKFLTTEAANQFSSLLVECKQYIQSRGALFEHSQQGHLMRSRIAEYQTNRKAIFRRVGQGLYQVLKDVEEISLARSRRALFGDDFAALYEMLNNRLLFVEGGNDEQLLLEHYILLGNFLNDPDRFEVFDGMLLDLAREFVLPDESSEELARAHKSYERLNEQARALRAEIMRLEQEKGDWQKRSADGEELFPWIWKRRSGGGASLSKQSGDLQRRLKSLELNLGELGPAVESAREKLEFLTAEYQSRLGDYLNSPENARRLFGPAGGLAREAAETQTRLLDEWVARLNEKELVPHMVASYEVQKIAGDYCPPVHLQHLKKALVSREEAKRVEQILEQFPARKLSPRRLEESARALRRCSPEQVRATAQRFAEDLMRLRRDRRNYQQVSTLMERIHIVRSEHSRELSRANNSLFELLFPEEEKPRDDAVVTHAVIKADVRGSTGITKELLARGLNPASHFSMILHEPVKRLLDRYGAAKVFIEGDAIILAIYETETTRTAQHAVAKACVLAREILNVTETYNTRAEASNLPRLELGVGVAFQNSAPSLWMDGDSRIMISKALNLSDRLSSCTKMARRVIAKNPSPFNVFLLQSLMEDAVGDEGEELMVRYNLNGIELNEEGFQKLQTEISLSSVTGVFPLPWGKQKTQLYFGQLPLGGVLEPIVIRKGNVRQLLPGGKIGDAGPRVYYEVCTNAKLTDMAGRKVTEAAASN